MHGTDEWPLAEIISIKEEFGTTGYYVHYVDCELEKVFVLRNVVLSYFTSVNKRLDEWVLEDDLDTRKVQFPRKDGLTTGQNTTGVSTPKRLISTSRPTSPVHHHTPDIQVNGSAVLAAALQKKINRKRKAPSISAPPLTPTTAVNINVPTTPVTPLALDDDSQEPLEKTPRQSGSMVTHHDDVVTRMKNIQLIELGKHRIKPWYFSPPNSSSGFRLACSGEVVLPPPTGRGPSPGVASLSPCATCLPSRSPSLK